MHGFWMMSARILDAVWCMDFEGGEARGARGWARIASLVSTNFQR